MGFGLVRDRLGKTRERTILQQALEHYRNEHTTKDHVQLDSSIIAKAHMSLTSAREDWCSDGRLPAYGRV